MPKAFNESHPIWRQAKDCNRGLAGYARRVLLLLFAISCAVRLLYRDPNASQQRIIL